jgi:hypothetical protein
MGLSTSYPQRLTFQVSRFTRRLLGLSPGEATFARRGFREGDPAARLRLEQIGRTFIEGYNAALDETGPAALGARLNGAQPEFRGFAFEGAAMALSLLDLLTPWKRDRWSALLAGPGAGHVYMLHVGHGWALARLRRRMDRPPPRLDPLLGWLAVDGYGFHEGYFNPGRHIEGRARPSRLSGYARRVFDQGLGRSLWFVAGADVARIAEMVATFPSARRADLWSGLGLACAYAGGVDRPAVRSLREAAGTYADHLAQGAAFAAKARSRAGNPTIWTGMACEALCGTSAAQAARATDLALQDLRPGAGEPAYEAWRRRIREQFVSFERLNVATLESPESSNVQTFKRSNVQTI